MTGYESFCRPDPMYRGMDFFMLNGVLDDIALIKQLDAIYAEGVRCVLLRTYIGLQSDYPGPEFKAHVFAACEHARSLGMKVLLQAGYMPEHVLDLPKRYSLDYIKVYHEGEEIAEGQELLSQKEGLTFTLCHSDTFLDMFNEDAVDFYIQKSYGEMWMGFEEFFGDTVLSIWVDEPSYFSAFLPLPRGFLTLFRERWGYDLTENLHKLYTDAEGYRTVRYHYRKLLQERMEICYFARLRDWCNENGLWSSGHLMMEDSLETQILRAGAVMPFYRYFDIPGTDILQGEMNWRYSPLLPPEEGVLRYRPALNTTPLQMTSVARQTGKEFSLCEMYAVSTQNMTFRHQKHMFDYMAAQGINLRSVHGIFYSLGGRRKRTYPPQINYYQPYFDDLHYLYGYVASASRFVSLGEAEGDVLLIHPLDSAFCEYAKAVAPAVPKSLSDLRRRDRELQRLLTTLMLNGCNLDFGDERTLEIMGEVEGKHLRVGKMTYSTVVLPDLIEIQSGTLALLRRFSEAGGKIIVLGRTPTLVDGFETEENVLAGLGCVYAVDIAEVERLTKNRAFSFRSDFFDKTVYVRRRVEGKNGYYFLFNPDCSQAVEGTLSVRGTVRAELWDGFTHSRTPVSCRSEEEETVIPLLIPEGGSLMLVTEACDECKAETVPTPSCQEMLALSNEWEMVERDQKNVLLLEFCSYKKEDGAYTEKDYPVLAMQQILTAEDYHGPLWQKFVFHCEKPLDGLSLALEKADEHEIYLNGVRVEAKKEGYYLADDFEVVPLGRAKAGENLLELKRHYEPLSKMKSAIGSLFESRTGCEPESVYLLGDFAVRATTEPVRNGCVRFARHMVLCEEKKTVRGELTREGYPFYAGKITLRQRFYIDEKKNAPYFFSLEEMNACLVHVRLNGNELGILHSYPYRINASSALKAGENVLELTLVNTLRNLLGPYHNPRGEVGNLFGQGYKHQDAAWVGGAADDFEWFEQRESDTKKWTDSYMQVPFNVKDPKLLISRDKERF